MVGGWVGVVVYSPIRQPHVDFLRVEVLHRHFRVESDRVSSYLTRIARFVLDQVTEDVHGRLPILGLQI